MDQVNLLITSPSFMLMEVACENRATSSTEQFVVGISLTWIFKITIYDSSHLTGSAYYANFF